jgi:transposase
LSVTDEVCSVIGGVDTHKHSHHVAVIDTNGTLVADREFTTDSCGQAALLDWLREHGRVAAVGIEGTGFYGSALTRYLTSEGMHVVEVNRTNRAARRADGKSDRLDAEQAARAVLAKSATAVPKSKSGPIEVIRIMRVARSSAVKARTQTFLSLHGIVIGSPSPLRDELIKLSKRTLVNRCAGLRPETDELFELRDRPERLLLAAAERTLRELARRWLTLDKEVKDLDREIKTFVQQTAPELVALFGVGVESAGQFLVTVGDNPQRIRNEAAFAKLCGVAPQPASSGKSTGRHRLSRSGDRAANSALYIIAITRMRHHEPTRTYFARRTAEGLTKREVIRCLKRYIAREVFKALPVAASEGHRAAWQNIGASSASTRRSSCSWPSNRRHIPSRSCKRTSIGSSPTTTTCDRIARADA